jgi:hypothetical protein
MRARGQVGHDRPGPNDSLALVALPFVDRGGV